MNVICTKDPEVKFESEVHTFYGKRPPRLDLDIVESQNVSVFNRFANHGSPVRITYGIDGRAPIVPPHAVVWAHALHKQGLTDRLVRLQRSACISITGAMSTTPTTAMECILGVLPLDLHIQP